MHPFAKDCFNVHDLLSLPCCDVLLRTTLLFFCFLFLFCFLFYFFFHVHVGGTYALRPTIHLRSFSEVNEVGDHFGLSFFVVQIGC